MKVTCASMAITLLMGGPLLAQIPRTGSIERSHTSGRHSVFVRIDISPFDSKQHKIRYFRPTTLIVGQSCAAIDGKTDPLGVDCDLPRTQIRKISVTLNGAELVVPVALYHDCFNVFSDNQADVRLSDDKKGAFLFVGGGDGSGSYQIVWVFRQNGDHSRLSCAPAECGDNGFINFEGGFLRANEH